MTAEPDTTTARGSLVAFGAIMLATLLAALDQTIVATALPKIVTDLHGFEHLSWVVTAYLVTSTVTVPLYGKLSDLYGRRRLFVVAISTFLAGSALCGAAQSMGQLIAFRALQGVGAGGLIPLAQAAIADLFPPRERGRYQAYISGMWAIAAVAGPLLGGTRPPPDWTSLFGSTRPAARPRWSASSVVSLLVSRAPSPATAKLPPIERKKLISPVVMPIWLICTAFWEAIT